MERNTEKTYPYRLPFGIQITGRSVPVWVYDRVPETMRPARDVSELWRKRDFLYPSALSPGEYLTGYMRQEVRPFVEQLLSSGTAVYVKKD